MTRFKKVLAWVLGRLSFRIDVRVFGVCVGLGFFDYLPTELEQRFIIAYLARNVVLRRKLEIKVSESRFCQWLLAER